MLVQHLDPLASSLFSLLAITSLLLSFVMLGSRWLKNYLYAFAAESWAIAALSAAVGFYGNYPELYLIAVLTLLFRGLLLPYLIWRIIRRLDVDREIHEILQPSQRLVVGALCVMFALAVSYRVAAEFHLELTVAVLALTVMLSMKLIGFLMLGDPPRGDQPDSRSARARKRHLSRLADPGAGHAAADRAGDPVRPADRRRVLRRARRLSVDPCRDDQYPRA